MTGMRAALGSLLLIIVLVQTGLSPVQAAPFYPGIHYYSSSLMGYFTFSNSFEATQGTHTASYLTFQGFKWGTYTYGTIGFGIGPGAWMEVTDVSATQIAFTVTNPLPSVNVYVYTPGKSAPGSVTGATSFSQAGDLVTVVVPTGTVSIVMVYGAGGSLPPAGGSTGYGGGSSSTTTPGQSLTETISPAVQNFWQENGTGIILVSIISLFVYVSAQNEAKKRKRKAMKALVGPIEGFEKGVQGGLRWLKKDVWED